MAKPPSVAIRLGTEGKGQVKTDFAEIRTAGTGALGDIGDSARKLSQDASKEAERLASAYERAASRADKALEVAFDADRRKAAQAAKISAIMPKTALQMQVESASGSRAIGGVVERDLSASTGFGQLEGSARVSAMAIQELLNREEQLIAKAAALKAVLDPVTAAQNRFNAEMAELKAMAPHLSVDQLTQAEARLKTELDQTVASHLRVQAASGAMRAGLQQAGFQVQDFLVQVEGGTDALRAFSMQAPQLIGNVQMMTSGAEKGAGKFAAFANIIGGPWGVALGVAIPLAGLLAGKLLEDGDASEVAKKAAEEHKQAIEALNVAMEQSIVTAEQKARANYIELESERLKTIEVRKSTQAQLEQAKLLAENAKGSWIGANGPNGASSIVANQYATRVDTLEKALADNQKELDRLTQNATIARGQYQATIIDQVSDPRGRAKREYDNLRNDAIRDGRGAEAIAAIERAREAEYKKIDATNKALREGTKLRDGANATPTQVSKLLQEAFGGTITSTTGGKHVKNSYHYRGQAVDFVPTGGMASLTKEQIRAVVEGAGLTVKELLGPGDKGHSDHFHLAWSGGRYDSRAGKTPDEQQTDRSTALGKAIGLEGIGAIAAEEQAAVDALTEALKKAIEADVQRRERIADMLGQGSDELRLAQLELTYRGRIGTQEAKILELERERLDLKRQFPDITDQELGSLIAQKAELLELNDLLDRQRAAWDEVQSAGENLVDTALNPQNFRDWGDAGKAILGELEAEMWRLAAINPIKNWLFGGNLPTLFGGSSGIMSLLSGGSGSVAAQVIPSSRGLNPSFAAVGTEYASGGATWLAENGPELVDLPRGAKVTPAAETRRILGSESRSGTVIFAPDMRGAVMTEDLLMEMRSMATVAAEYGASDGAARALAESRYGAFRSLDGR